MDTTHRTRATRASLRCPPRGAYEFIASARPHDRRAAVNGPNRSPLISGIELMANQCPADHKILMLQLTNRSEVEVRQVSTLTSAVNFVILSKSVENVSRRSVLAGTEERYHSFAPPLNVTPKIENILSVLSVFSNRTSEARRCRLSLYAFRWEHL